MSSTIYHFQYIKANKLMNYSKSSAIRFFQGTQERVRNSHGKRAISVRATEVILYNAISSGSTLFALRSGIIYFIAWTKDILHCEDFRLRVFLFCFR